MRLSSEDYDYVLTLAGRAITALTTYQSLTNRISKIIRIDVTDIRSAASRYGAPEELMAALKIKRINPPIAQATTIAQATMEEVARHA